MKRYLVGLLVLMLAACGSDGEEINVREKWGNGLANYGISPLYPMREDIYVGDVLLFVPSPCKGDDSPKSSQTVVLGSLPQDLIAAEFDKFYMDRPRLPKTTPPEKEDKGTSRTTTTVTKNSISVSMTSNGGSTVTASNTPPAGTAANSGSSGAVDSPPSDSIFVRQKKNPLQFSRLPMVAFPAVSLYSYKGGAFGGAAPVGPFAALRAAFGGQSTTQLSVKATRVEVSQLPGPTGVRLMRDFLPTDRGMELFDIATTKTLIAALTDEMRSQSGCAPTTELRRPRIIFINAVYYTRSMEFSFGQNSAFAAQVAATLGGGASLPAQQFTGPSLADAPATGASPAQASALATLKGLSAMSGGPGLGFSFAMGSEGDLALTQSFERPMAFGVGRNFTCYLDELWLYYKGLPPDKDSECRFMLNASPGRLAVRQYASAWKENQATDYAQNTSIDWHTCADCERATGDWKEICQTRMCAPSSRDFGNKPLKEGAGNKGAISPR